MKRKNQKRIIIKNTRNEREIIPPVPKINLRSLSFHPPGYRITPSSGESGLGDGPCNALINNLAGEPCNYKSPFS